MTKLMKNKVISFCVIGIAVIGIVFGVFYYFFMETTDYYTVERNSTMYGKWFDYLSNDPEYKIRKFSSGGNFEDRLYIQGIMRGGELRHAKEEIRKAIPDTTDSRYRDAIERLYAKETILLGITHTRNHKIDEDLIKNLVRIQSQEEMNMCEDKYKIRVQMDVVPEI